jgi:ParB family chromosome partitioning protein
MINFNGLADFDVTALKRNATGEALILPLDKIEPDPDQIRTTIDPAELQGLAASIKTMGLIQPICVRQHPQRKGCYIINVGERRWRASQLLNKTTIAAYIREDFDPFVQAAENIHREGLNPLDIARFIAKHEAQGMTRSAIARKLGIAASFITEVASLSEAPQPLLLALNEGRIRDTRTAYLLAKAWNSHGADVNMLLAGSTPLTRETVSRALGTPPAHGPEQATTGTRARRTKCAEVAKPWNALAVEVAGRHGHLPLRAGDGQSRADVWFEDGARESVELSEIKLLTWTTWK